MQHHTSETSVHTSSGYHASELVARNGHGRRFHDEDALDLDQFQNQQLSSKRPCLDKENHEAQALNKLRLLSSSNAPPAPQPSSSIPRQAFSDCAPAPTISQPQSSESSFVDIDSFDLDDPMACSEYAQEIFDNLRHSETLRRPSTTYMESVQTDINPAMRAILVDWLVEVGQEYRLASDTLFLSVAYIDRFLSLVDVGRNKLQLVGVTSMLIASKYEEIYAPQVEEFCYITDNTYTRDMLLGMEKQLLDALDFDLTQPTTKTFLRRFIKAAAGEIDVTVTFEFLCSYLAELTMMEYSLLGYLPSHVAASCVLVALHYLGKPHWSNTLAKYSGYTPAELKHCAQAIHSLFVGAKSSALPASREKYANSKFGSVSKLEVSEVLSESLFTMPW